MEVAYALAGCLMMGIAVYLVVGQALGVPHAGPGARRLRPRRLREALVSWMELLGHWVPLVRLSNLPLVAAPSERLRAALALRGLALTRRACVAFFAASLMACALLCLALSRSLLGLPVGVVCAFTAAVAVVGRHERAMRNGAAEQMPEVLRSLSAALGAGKSLPQAIEHVGLNLGEPMGSEFLKASFEVKAGRPVEDAVGDLCARVDAPGVALLGTALQISQRTGSSLNDLFTRTAGMVADTVNLRRELQVKTSQVRLSSKIVSGMPAVLACLLILFSEDYRAGLGLPAGRACLCVAVLLDVVALWSVQRLMRRSLT